jgi:agmatine/peptidylarginine deiminase
MASSLETGKKEEHLIVLSIPDDAYYRKSLEDIECFIRDMSEKTRGLDDFLVIYSKSMQKRYKNSSTPPLGLNTTSLTVEESLDLWMRDFSPVLPKHQVKFTYKPKYLKSKDAKFVESEFMKVLRKMDIQLNRDEIVIDGGNIVDNNRNKAIISERIFAENKGKTPHVLKSELENLLAAKVAFIPDPEDTTGHADGIAAFVEDNVLLIGDYGDEEYYNSVEYAVKSVFPEVETCRLPCGCCDNESTSTDSSGNKQCSILVQEKAKNEDSFIAIFWEMDF